MRSAVRATTEELARPRNDEGFLAKKPIDWRAVVLAVIGTDLVLAVAVPLIIYLIFNLPEYVSADYFSLSFFYYFVYIGALLYKRSYADTALTNMNQSIEQSMRAEAVAFGTLVTFVLFIKYGDQLSRLWTGSFLLISTGMHLTVRMLVFVMLKRSLRTGRRLGTIAIVHGPEPLHPTFLNFIAGLRRQGWGLTSFVTSGGRANLRVAGEEGAAPVDLAELVRERSVSRVLIYGGDRASAAMQECESALRHLDVELLVYPSINDVRDAVSTDTELGAALLRIRARPIRFSGLLLKRTMDLAVASLLIVLLSPLLLLTALAILIDSGRPIFFVQPRMGFSRAPFNVYKFRTMRVHTPKDGTIAQAKRIDPRVTRLGRWLRRLSIDELPQLLNVLRGEMSLVGPRPHAISHSNAFGSEVDEYLARYRVKPGITGWAQVNGYRGEIDTPDKLRKRVEHDLYYVENWSLLFDVRILLMTGIRIIDRNAY